MGRLDYRILGTLQVLRDGEPLDVGGRRQRELLALLLLSAGAVVPSDRLIDELWGDESPDSVHNALQVYVSRLRKTLEPDRPTRSSPRVLLTESTGYRLVADPIDVDASRFEAAIAAGTARLSEQDAAGAERSLREALALWRGPALVDFAYAGFAQAEIRRLEELRLQATEHLLEARLALGAHREAIADLESLVAAHPLRERFRHLLALALYRCGQQVGALDAIRDAREVLVAEAGLDPGAELAGLEDAILRQDPSLDSDTPMASRPRTNIVVSLTTFVGRRTELGEASDIITGRTRLLTFTGPGGCGKTRLATELASTLIERFTDGVWFVDLAAVTEPALVPRTVARVLGVSEEPGRVVMDALTTWAHDKRFLVVLDNVEHLIDAAAAAAQALLTAGPDIRVIVTGREALGLAGEVTILVPSLSLPRTDEAAADLSRTSEAVQLFCERARDRWPGFALSATNATAVASICRRLDGIPLAIELAAACLTSIPETELAQRLEERFALLVGGDRTAHPRQRTLRATVDWSYELLSESERVAFRRLGVFAASFTLEGAEAVCAGGSIDTTHVVPLVARLVAASLITPQGTVAGRARYRMLDTIRAYARERTTQAGEDDDVRTKHAVFMERAAARLNSVQSSGRQGTMRFDRRILDAVEVERDDFRAALRWAIDAGQARTALGLATAMWFPWRAIGLWNELRGWLDEAIAISDDVRPDFLGGALGVAAAMAGEQGDWHGRISLCERALDLFAPLKHHLGMGWMLHVMAHAYAVLDDVDEAERCQASAIDELLIAQDAFSVSFAQFVWSWMLVGRGDFDRARSLADDVEARARREGHDDPLGQSEAIHGFLAAAEGDWGRGSALYTRGIDRTISAVEQHHALLAIGRLELSNAAKRADGVTKIRRAIEIARRIGFPERRRWELEAAAAASSVPIVSARLFGAADQARSDLNTHCPFPAQNVIDEFRRACAAELGPEAYERESLAGRSLAPAEALDLALA